MLSWYLIQSKPSAESVAHMNLMRQGYDVYFPRLNKPVRSRGRWRDRVVALFPRYLFLRLNAAGQSLAPVRSTLGVHDIVRFGFQPAVVPVHVIDELRSRADPDTGLHHLVQRPKSLVPGTSVRITSGPFDGLEGVFEREDGSDRVILLLNLLGQEARVRVPVDVVKPSRAIP